MRRVVVLFGPPGSGKTTAANEAPSLDGWTPTIYDRDDPWWTSERQFSEALTRLASRDGYAVVIRTGMTSAARAKTVRSVGATHAYMMSAPRSELERRVRERGRNDKTKCLAALARWRDERDDAIPTWGGWAGVEGNQSAWVTTVVGGGSAVVTRDL